MPKCQPAESGMDTLKPSVSSWTLDRCSFLELSVLAKEATALSSSYAASLPPPTPVMQFNKVKSTLHSVNISSQDTTDPACLKVISLHAENSSGGSILFQPLEKSGDWTAIVLIAFGYLLLQAGRSLWNRAAEDGAEGGRDILPASIQRVLVTSQPPLMVNAAGQTLDRLTVPPSHWWSRPVHTVDHHPQKRQKAPPADVFQPSTAAPVPPKEQRDNDRGSLAASIYTTRELGQHPTANRQFQTTGVPSQLLTKGACTGNQGRTGRTSTSTFPAPTPAPCIFPRVAAYNIREISVRVYATTSTDTSNMARFSPNLRARSTTTFTHSPLSCLRPNSILTLAKSNTFPGLPKLSAPMWPKTYAKHTPEQTFMSKGSCYLHQYNSPLPKTQASSAVQVTTSAIPMKDCSTACFSMIIPEVNHSFLNKVTLLELWTESLPACHRHDPLPGFTDIRLANVTPIYKQGRKEDPGNYRSVSLTSESGKVMEQMILSAIMQHIQDNQAIRPSQHGFMKGRSCLTKPDHLL
ncbi:hypothetical protein QYF61_010012 [Mycteria americana]|uniref:Reverse transcriptase domain-containing protein n=1 Tax=Mycteria americana TaxID=33587 RepID=A0AAN7NIA6_MYCAM|nr:hypothetical protein QYF61_010012 [Mycteria americana]